jgi:hypothetical protein
MVRPANKRMFCGSVTNGWCTCLLAHFVVWGLGAHLGIFHRHVRARYTVVLPLWILLSQVSARVSSAKAAVETGPEQSVQDDGNGLGIALKADSK